MEPNQQQYIECSSVVFYMSPLDYDDVYAFDYRAATTSILCHQRSPYRCHHHAISIESVPSSQ